MHNALSGIGRYFLALVAIGANFRDAKPRDSGTSVTDSGPRNRRGGVIPVEGRNVDARTDRSEVIRRRAGEIVHDRET